MLNRRHYITVTTNPIRGAAVPTLAVPQVDPAPLNIPTKEADLTRDKDQIDDLETENNSPIERKTKSNPKQKSKE